MGLNSTMVRLSPKDIMPSYGYHEVENFLVSQFHYGSIKS
mgnify:CR=1 FL=1